MFLLVPSHPLPSPHPFLFISVPSILSQPFLYLPFPTFRLPSFLVHLSLPMFSIPAHPFRSLIIPIPSDPLIPHPFPLLSVPYISFHLFPSLVIPCISSYSFPSLPSLLNPSYTFPFQPPGFPPFSFPSLPIFPIPYDPLSSSSLTIPYHPIPSLPILYIPSHSFPSLSSLHHPCSYFPIHHYPFPPLYLLSSLPVPSILSNSFPLPLVIHSFKSFPIPSYISHPFPSLTLSNFFSILPVRFRHIPFLLSRPSLPVPSRSRTSGSVGYVAQPGQVEWMFCRRGRRRHDHLWPMATSIGINIGSQPHSNVVGHRGNRSISRATTFRH